MKNPFIYLMLGTCLVGVGMMSCQRIDTADPVTGTTENTGANFAVPDWTAATHGNQVQPNYDEVFPQEKVNALEIRLASGDWQKIREDMTEKFGGDFGASGTTTTNPGAGGGVGVPGAGAGGGGVPGAGGGNIPPRDSTMIGGGGTPPDSGGVAIPTTGGNNGAVAGATTFGTGEPSYFPASVKYNGKEWYKVGFRLKGNSSLSRAWSSGIYKLPFRLNFDKFEDLYPQINNQRFYGFKDLSFSPAFGDNSLMRDKVANDVFRAAGVPAAKTSFCKIYVDLGDGQGLKYFGLYTVIEVIDDTMVWSQFGGHKSGTIYKPDGTPATFALNAFSEAGFPQKNKLVSTDWSDVKAVFSVLHSTDRTSNASQWRANLEKVFNVDAFLKWLAVNTTMVAWDSYGAMAHNYYLYNQSGKGLTWIPWDLNDALGNGASVGGGAAVGGGMSSQQGLALNMSGVSTSWPLIRYLYDDTVYQEKYKSYVKSFTENVFTPDKMNAIFDKNYALIAPFVIGTNGEQPKYTYLSSEQDFTNAIITLKNHVVSRNQAVQTYLK
ncbi:CotH kinase family protein [Flectobacillus major]|uniref:CotH kinase family protein n=1 Tax=Flectobacillus major TaxID=103 RepID=UPI000402957D|nr:CotH kinase family protein [Flectobacillus major]